VLSGPILGVPFTFASNTNSTVAPKGGLFGGQLGFNWQTGPVVWGVEGDIQWASQTATACGEFCTNIASPVVPGLTVANVAPTVYQKVKWFGTARGRVGYANNGAMIYVTAGGAWAGIDETDNFSINAPIPPFLFTSAQTASFSRTASGYAVGGGIEMRLWAGLTAKVEYLHLDLGGVTNTFAFVPPEPAGTTLTTVHNRFKDEIVRVGLNYKFGNYYAPVVTK
jgi:outer membrane immunogenic protein